MKATPFVVTCATAFLTAYVAQAFSITAVSLSPSNAVAQTVELQMTISITTPSQPTRLYAPTQISSNSAGIRLDVYPTSGVLTAIGSLRETVVLGTFPVGTYNYEVQIHPDFQVNWGVRTHRGTFTVTNGTPDPQDRPIVSISGFSNVLEFCPPNADCPGINFFLRRTGPGLEQPLMVFIQYRGTAVSGLDYAALPAPVTFEAGSDFLSVFSSPIDDTLYEGDETVIAEVIPLNTYDVDLNRWQTTTVIRDNDVAAPPFVSLELVDPVAMETLAFQNFAKWAEFRVVRTGPATNELVVFLESRRGSATFGQDYWLDRVTNGTVRFPANARSVNVRLYVRDDDIDEGDETAFPQLIAPPLGTPLSEHYTVDNTQSSVALVIHDNEPPNRASGRVLIFDRQTPIVPPTVSIEATAPEARECGLNENCAVARGRLTIRRMGELDYPLALYVASEGTALRGVDYRYLLPNPSQQNFSRLLTLPSGQSRWNLDIDPIDDRLAEGDETATLRLLQVIIDTSHSFPPADYTVDNEHASATVVIHDNDPDTMGEQPAGPRLVGPTLSAEGLVQFLIVGGRGGQTNVVEVSTDLVNWSPISTNFFPTTACPLCPFIDFAEPVSANLNRRFYRALNR